MRSFRLSRWLLWSMFFYGCDSMPCRLIETHPRSWGKQCIHFRVKMEIGDSTEMFIHSAYLRDIIPLTPWSRVLLEKLAGYQLDKKFPTFYGTRKFITTFTRARHLSLSWARCIQSMPQHPTSWRSILILSSHPRLGLPANILSPLKSCEICCLTF